MTASFEERTGREKYGSVGRTFSIVLFAMLLVAGCGGGGGDGADESGGTAALADGLDTSGLAAGTVRVADLGSSDVGPPERVGLTVAGDGRTLAAWSFRGLWWSTGDPSGWSAPALLQSDVSSPVRLSGNVLGEAVAVAKTGALTRIFRYAPATTSWSEIVDAMSSSTDVLQSGVAMLRNGDLVYSTSRARGTPPVSAQGSSVIVRSPSGVAREGYFAATTGGSTSHSRSVASALRFGDFLTIDDSADAARTSVAVWRELAPDFFAVKTTEIARGAGACEHSSFRRFDDTETALQGVVSDTGWGLAAVGMRTQVTSGYGDCELTLAQRTPLGVSAVQLMTTLPGRFLAEPPTLAAGGATTFAAWNDSSLQWLYIATTGERPLPAAQTIPTTGALDNIRSLAAVVDDGGRVTVAALVALSRGQSLDRIVVANYSTTTGWTPWRTVFAGWSAGDPSLAVRGTDVVLSWGAVPCDRRPASPEPVCTTRRNSGVFVLRNP